jgi:RNA polymerase sigma-70 factor (ECF subfamily)
VSSVDTRDTDAELLGRLCAGDTDALETLMRQYGNTVYRLAHGITRSAADAEEVTQDVFLTVLRKGASFEGRAALGSWIYRVTANAALNKRRGKARQLETFLEDALPQYRDDGHRDGDRTFLLADWSASPEHTLLSGEARAVLAAAIDALPDRYRAVLVLRDVEELSNEQVAEMIGESVASVKSRLHRARMALRELLTRHLAPTS